MTTTTTDNGGTTPTAAGVSHKDVADKGRKRLITLGCIESIAKAMPQPTISTPSSATAAGWLYFNITEMLPHHVTRSYGRVAGQPVSCI
jgi:hypothetical protein